MINLHPKPSSVHFCPYDESKLTVLGPLITGMRNLAELKCSECGKEFYGDLLVGHGLYYPMLLEKNTGKVFDKNDVNWFRSILEKSYANRSSNSLRIKKEKFREMEKPLLLNCLDFLYGHSLLKLLNAQYYIDKASEYDLFLVIPSCLRWMIPEGVAEVWSVEWSFAQGIQRNDWFAKDIHQKLESYPEVKISIALSHPHPKDFCIERFTGIKPFPIGEWEDRMESPTVTFIWRSDRCWLTQTAMTKKASRIKNLINYYPRINKNSIEQQTNNIVSYAEGLRKRIKNLRFSVLGIGEKGGLPDWIDDIRCSVIDDNVEKEWCQHYARSQIVVGVHGSNMLLPSGHAGATIDLCPSDRLYNISQDILFGHDDVRTTEFLYRVLPMTTQKSDLIDITCSILTDFPLQQINMNVINTDHSTVQATNLYNDRRRVSSKKSTWLLAKK